MSDDAIPAATLVLWRDTPGGPEILVVQRSARMAFAAGAIPKIPLVEIRP